MEYLRRGPSTIQGLLVLAAFLVLGACDDPGSPEPRGPGSIQVDLVSPNGAEGSAVFELQIGSSVGAVSSFAGDVYYEHNRGLETSRVIVVMDVPGQVSFKVSTQDVGEVPSVTLLQVADGEDRLRASLSGYDVQVTPLPAGGSS